MGRVGAMRVVFASYKSVFVFSKEDFRFITLFEVASKDTDRAKFDQQAASTLEQVLGQVTKIDAGALDRLHVEIWQTVSEHEIPANAMGKC